MVQEQDHYAVLDTHPDASDAEIKRRYRQLMRGVHPDANAHDPEATRKAARLNVAFETLGDPEKRRAYDERYRPRKRDRMYRVWAEQPDWEDIVAEHVPHRRPAHVHAHEPLMEPEELEVDMAELRAEPRVRRRIKITNTCACTIAGDVSTSEPWLRGPVGRLRAGPGETIEFDVEVIATKVTFPGISRAIFVAAGWTGVVPVRITGYEPKRRRTYAATESAYVPMRRRKAVRR
jgi:curved DNA-binding protein CbpA